jgi:membrane fusion protein (multidrug efflux system)
MLALWRPGMRGLIGLALVSLAGCSDGDPRQRPAPEVGFVVAKPSTVPIVVERSGRTVAFETSEVRPQITGIIRKRLFTEGSVVRAGQPLYQIDDSLYRAAVAQAEANLASARASADAATARADRYRPLAEQQAISQQEYTDATAQARVGRASVAQSTAALETARINLRFTTITAPISGRIGRSLSTVGALVNANQASPLAVIARLDPMFVDIKQSSAELTQLRQQLASGAVETASTSVRLKLEDGSDYPYPGEVQFADVTVEESTGTVTLRARFPNPEGMLLPGMFVRAAFDQALQPNAFLVPQAALQRDFNGSAFVYVVGADNKVQQRTVTADRTYGNDWVVTSGLKDGDRVISQGLGNNVRQGAEVRPVPANTPQRIGAPRGAPGRGGPGGGGRAG